MTEPLRPFDLTPATRILPVLGEISLAQWRCIAELIDNSVDGFLAAQREGHGADLREVKVNIPTSDGPNTRLTVIDNGPGMAPATLEQAVKAGWSGNSPIGSLGMFGMGFNIATARLGTVTTVWTTQAGDDEWHGVRIDFDALRTQGHYGSPHLTRPKVDAADHGTEVTVQNLKPEQLAWLTRQSNVNRVRRSLSETYSSMLKADGLPIGFSLLVNGRVLQAKNHCVWDESREVETARYGRVPAVITIDRRLPPRPFCTACWQWLAAQEQKCPVCDSSESVVDRERHVHGWIGLQRYLSTSEFGVDFIRNGRKIEVANRDLFEWVTEDGAELEYPIDDPRSRGRIVGEIHLDHCRVSYTKDRFDRTDPAWDEMREIVRGEGPLLPQKAAAAGFGENSSPLFRLFQAFRRSQPQNRKLAGAWAKVLVVKDNQRAEEMAGRFRNGDSEYLTDEKWWALVEEEDQTLLTPDSDGSDSEGELVGFASAPAGDQSDLILPTETPEPPAPSVRTPIPSLTREYRHEGTGLRWDVRAWLVESGDPDLRPTDEGWRLIRRTSGESDFLIIPTHAVFSSATLTLLDALLAELAWSGADAVRTQPEAPSFGAILADLRLRYAKMLELDPTEIKARAEATLAAIARSWAPSVAADDRAALFDDLSSSEQEAIFGLMAIRSISDPVGAVRQGRFLEFAAPGLVVEFVIDHPELFFDGRCFDEAYATIDFPTDEATTLARDRVVRDYLSLLGDAAWLATHEPDELSDAPRDRLLRASLGLDLLANAHAEGADVTV